MAVFVFGRHCVCVCVCWVLRNREAVTVKRANYCDAARWETWISESGQKRGFNVGFCLLCTMRRMSNLFTRRRVRQKSTKNAQRPEALWLNLLCFDYVSAQPRLLRLRFCCTFFFFSRQRALHIWGNFIWVSMSVIVRVSAALWHESIIW